MKPTPRFKYFTALNSLAVIIAAVTLLSVAPAYATNNCVQDEYRIKTGSSTAKLTCTSSDVTITKASNIRNLDGTTLTTCNAGQTFNFLADFTLTTSTSERDNIGIYFGTAQATALTGVCLDNIISPIHPNSCISSPGTGTPQCVGSAGYHDLQHLTYGCGDISSTFNNQVITVELDSVKCNATPGTSLLALPYCLSWQQPGGIIACNSTSSSYPYVDAAVPGSRSKCNCVPGYSLNINVQTPGLLVTKTPSVNPLTDPGGAEQYNIDIKNNSNFGDVTIKQVCDDQYGNIATASGFTPACSAGATGSASSNTCSLPQTISQGDTYSCHFSGNVPETGLTDTVTVKAVDINGAAITPVTASATVTVTEATATAATVTSSASTVPTSGCATVRYGVTVTNSSGGTTDETETLSALNDTHFGDITTVGGNVLGTTCDIDTGSIGSGTLSGSPGAGTFEAIAVGGHYTCQFDGKICGTGPLATPTNLVSCPAGAEQIGTVTATLTGDESETPTQTAVPLTVDVCFSTTETTATPTPTP